MHSILFVDDEQPILRSLRRLFHNKGLNLYFAEDGISALKILSENNIDMVISDMRMPNMNGHKLLKEIKRLYPQTIRFILSGYSDENEMYQAVLDGSAKRYLLKPWDPQQLSSYLLDFLNLRDLLISKKILDHISNLKTLYISEQGLKKFNQLFEYKADLEKIENLIQTEPGISLGLLHLVNSSFYEYKIYSIRQAASKIGIPLLKAILNNTDYAYRFNENNACGSQYCRMTQHSRITEKIMAATFHTYLKKEIPDLASMACALHNVGALFSENSGIPHDEYGGYLMKWWGLPSRIVECANFHHKPFRASEENQELVQVLYLASYYAGEFLGQDDGKLDERVFQSLDINRDQYEELIKKGNSYTGI